MRYYEQSGGELKLVEGGRNPFREIVNHTYHHKPIMADWNGDGYMDVILITKISERLTPPSATEPLVYVAYEHILCTMHVYEQQKGDGGYGKISWVRKTEPFFRSPNCFSLLDGSRNMAGASFVDTDQDGKVDLAVFGANNGPLHVYERTVQGFVKQGRTSSSDSTPLDMIQMDKSIYFGNSNMNFFFPVLADWDLDGDLDLALLLIGDLDLSVLGKEDLKPRYFEHLADNTVRELPGPPDNFNSSCPIDWSKTFSFADFDGDGKKDLLGFHHLTWPDYIDVDGDGVSEKVGDFHSSTDVILCLQTSSGLVMVEPAENPFDNQELCNDESKCPWDGDGTGYGVFSWTLFPSFLDWDADGDMDMLRITSNLGKANIEGFQTSVCFDQKP